MTNQIIKTIAFVFCINIAQAKNTIILLDLSDRILIAGQANKDQSIILREFEGFEKQARQKFFINSSDSFVITIAPQVGGLEIEEYNLSLDLGALPKQEKFRAFDSFKKRLIPTLKQLYTDALKGKSKSQHFKGSDIWKFFNDELPFLLKKNTLNQLIVVTVCYYY